jgi:DNA-3-methyladenine glycosylase II
MATSYQDKLRQGTQYLGATDSELAAVIANSDACTTRPHRNYYQALVGEIIGQQLSVKAAATIRRRFVALFGGSFPEPAAILRKTVDELRAVGLSRPKGAYIRDLAGHILDGSVKFDHFNNLNNDEIIAELTAVKGVGEWTAHMFLMFCMGRLDVLANGDLGIRHGVKSLYGFDHLPSPDEVKALAASKHWHPYETLACWYIWQSKDNK